MTNTTLPVSLDALAIGRTSSNPFVDQFETRSPTIYDIQYPIQKKWLNTATEQFYELQNFYTTAEFPGQLFANWILIGGSSVVETLTGNDGIIVPPTNNNINVVGDGTYITTTGNAATSTLTINLLGDVATKFGVDAHTNPGTNPVVPANGLVTITGGQVPASTTANVIRTDSLAANTYTVEVQRTQAVASSTIGDNGVAHFNSADFSVDANGFVSLVGGAAATKFMVDAHTNPGTNPVVPNASGVVTITGGQVPAGTTANVIRTDSLAANTYTVEVQRSQAVASSTIGDNGVCHFSSSEFSVDSNGFVTLTGVTATKPAFAATLTSQQANVTGDNTAYTVIFDTELYDNLSNYNTGTGVFTAPVAGVYQFNTAISVYNLGASHTVGYVYLNTSSSAPIYGNTWSPEAAAGVPATTQCTFVACSLIKLPIGGTVSVVITIAGSTKTVGVQAEYPSVNVTTFSGALIS